MTPIQNLFISHGFRVFFTLFVLFLIHIPLFFKVILIMISDFFDNCIPLRRIFPDWINPNTEMYQISDKITDLVTYYILFLYLFRSQYLERKENLILFILLLYRSIGEIIFFITKERKFLIFFPNFFLEVSFMFIGMKYVNLSKKYLPFFIILIIIWKLVQEYYLHIYKVKQYEED